MRVRRSLQEIASNYDSGNRTELENLIKAFRVIQTLPVDHPDSFFRIAGYHGEPFVSEAPAGQDPGDWWGGYCQHNTILFPTWHRAYLHRIEEALRNAVPQAEDLALPFWDECISHGTDENPIPWIVTARELPVAVDGRTDNPLFSYTLQVAVADDHNVSKVGKRKNHRYSKPAGYETVRYPLSGLVGNDKDRAFTELHNSDFTDDITNTGILNDNVKAWMGNTIRLKNRSDSSEKILDTYSSYSKYKICLEAPNYTAFSNKDSMANWVNKHPVDYCISLEDPHNEVHLAVGGHPQFADDDLDRTTPGEIKGANGDMGENETAAFDPIFFFHHAFIDYVFWQWQLRHGQTKANSLKVLTGYGGITSKGSPGLPAKTELNLDSPLLPFAKASGSAFTSNDVTDIEGSLGYTYSVGSLDREVLSGPVLNVPDKSLITRVLRVSNISRADYSGSFVVRVVAKLSDGETVEIGRDAVLSRWHVDGCANCRNHLDEQVFVPIDEELMALIKGDGAEEDIKNKIHVFVQKRDDPDREEDGRDEDDGEDSPSSAYPVFPTPPGLSAPRRQPVIDLL